MLHEPGLGLRRSLVMGLVGLAACLLVLVVGGSSARAAFAGSNGRIAFSSLSDMETDLDVFVVNPDGSGLADFTTLGSDDTAPAFSPDGSRIAFTSNRDGNQEIYVMNADGTGLARLTTNPARDFAPAFSADGSRIAFVSDRDGHDQIYSLGLDGSGLTRLTTSAGNDTDPAFSADGSRLAFTSDRDGNREIYVAGADGTHPVRLTNDPAADYQPNFSPDGSRIAFTSERNGGVAHVWVMGADGSAPTQLTSGATSSDHDPSFSPDGTKIAFASDPLPCPAGYACGQILGGAVNVIGSDGSTQPTAVAGSVPQADPDWGVSRTATPPPPPTADTTPPDTTITSGTTGPTCASTQSFSFTGSDNTTPAGQLEYAYRVDGGAWSGYSTATSATVTTSDGPHTFSVKARDQAGNEDPTPAERAFTVDTVAPSGTVTIQGGATRTRSLTVTLTLSASDPAPATGVSAMRISNTASGLTSATWTQYATSQPWTLSSGPGTKTVYAQYRDAAGNVSPIAQGSITYKP